MIQTNVLNCPSCGADLLRLGFGAMDEKEARRWSTPPSL